MSLSGWRADGERRSESPMGTSGSTGLVETAFVRRGSAKAAPCRRRPNQEAASSIYLFFAQEARGGAEEFDVALEMVGPRRVLDAHLELERAGIAVARQLQDQRLHQLAERADFDRGFETGDAGIWRDVGDTDIESRGDVSLVDDPHEKLVPN